MIVVVARLSGAPRRTMANTRAASMGPMPSGAGTAPTAVLATRSAKVTCAQVSGRPSAKPTEAITLAWSSGAAAAPPQTARMRLGRVCRIRASVRAVRTNLRTE
jgi:hypothetical protein